MKKIILGPLLLLAVLLARGQEYVPLLDANKAWNIFERFLSGSPYHNPDSCGATYPVFLEKCETDTLKYIVKKRLPGQVFQTLGIIHEDIDSKKVYYKCSYCDDEVLLYDFNLEENDGIELGYIYMEVSGVDSIQLLDGSFRNSKPFFHCAVIMYIHQKEFHCSA
jgi:hypothetical protein